MKRDREWYINKAIEMSVCEKSKTIRTGREAYEVLKPYGLKEQEHFIVLNLNGAHEVLSINVVAIGIVNKCVVHPREVFRKAIADNSSAVLLCHNHPSGQLEPSAEDRNITTRLKEAGEIIGIAVLDHIIVTKKGYYSFIEEGETL